MRFAKRITAGVVLLVGLGLSAPTSADSGLTSLAQPVVRSPLVGESIYFVMTDRYRDGNPSNNEGGGPWWSQGGFDPTSSAYFHGGDLAGLTGTCQPGDDGMARIANLGFSGVWVTPPVVNRAVQGSSAGYHGYWFMDLSKPDPHLGTEQDFAALAACAQALDVKLIMDVVTNHTADVIEYRNGTSYVPVEERPYRTASGKTFNPFRFAARNQPLPSLSVNRSFPKVPFVDSSLENAKWPALLNQLTRYHNRGDIAWGSCTGECEMDGDFYGLDDVMTEDAEVVAAFADAYGAWIEKYGISGFRIDTAKHVDPYFFKRFLPQIQQKAEAAGVADFTSFSEVWLTDPIQLSEQMRTRALPSVLDFPFQDTIRSFVTKQGTGRSVAALFAEDDRYTTATTNAQGLATFLGNHDMGRIGFFLRTQTNATPPQLLERDALAHDLLFLTRGVPVVYYGDEVGMTGSGDGRDQRARQNMFPTQVAEWKTEERIGSAPIGSGSSFTVSNPLEAHIRDLNALREAHPALASGPQVTRTATDAVFALSRFDMTDRREYVVAFNTSDGPATVSVPTSTPSATWTPLRGSAASSDAAGQVSLSIPARSSVVLRADTALPTPASPSVSVRTRPDLASGMYRLDATVPGSDPASVTFVMRQPGREWQTIGVDDARPFRVYVPALTKKAPNAQVAVVVTSSTGERAASAPSRVRLAPLF